MAVLPEIIAWSRERPLWQQDALRRLVEQPSLTPNDYDELVALCKLEIGIKAENSPLPKPLASAATSAAAEGTRAVRLKRVHSVKHVNALRDDQTLAVSPTGLTVVYGDNGAGKSDYVRILKQVCRARGGKDAVYSNVFADDTAPPSAVVCYDVLYASPPITGTATVGEQPVADIEIKWGAGAASPTDLTQVSVFDSKSASVYVSHL